MEGILVLATWAFCGWLCHTIAASKNRNKELWAVVGIFFGIFAVLVISLMPNLPIG